MDKRQLMEQRRQMFDKIERHLLETQKPEDFMFYYHPDEDRIVLSHAMFWVMSRSYEKELSGVRSLALLRRYQEEMLEAYLTESADFVELLRYCNLSLEVFPHELDAASRNPAMRKVARKLQGISVVVIGYGGDMPEELACELLDDIDFSYNKVCCHKIEQMLPQFNKLVEEELEGWNRI